MYLASAYPDPAISAGAMTAIALAATVSLAIWLSMVFIAARQSGKKVPARRAGSPLAALSHQGAAAEDGQGADSPATGGRRHGAAA